MSRPYDIRVRRYTPGGAAGPIVPTLTIDYTSPRSDVPTLALKMSGAIAGTLPDLTELAVELWNGATWTEPRDGRFFILKHSGDELDPAAVQNITCVAMASYLMSNALVATADGKDYEAGGTIGKTIGTVFTDAQALGWAPYLSKSFTDTQDSAGADWTPGLAALQGLTFKPGTSLKAMVQTMADQSALEYGFRGRILDIWNANTGADYTAAGDAKIQVGTACTELPVDTTLEDLATHVTIRGEGKTWTFPVPGSGEALGRLEKTIDAGGVTTQEQAAQIAELYQVTGSQPRKSYTYTEPAAAMAARPFIEYNNGDWISARRPNGWERMRVTQLQVRRDEKAVITVDVMLEDRLTDLASRIAKRNAGRVGGSGSTPSDTSSAGLGAGGMGSGKRGTLATPWGDDGAARVIFEGQTEPDRNRYRYLDSYQPVSADPVILSPFGDDGELVIMGRVRGLYIPAGGLYQGRRLSRGLDDRADYDGSRTTDFLKVLPDDKGEAGTGLTLDVYGAATTTEAGTWDIECQVTLDTFTPGTIWGSWGRPWLAMFLQVSSVLSDGGSQIDEYYNAPETPDQNTAQTVNFVDSISGQVTLKIKDRRTFQAGHIFQPQIVANFAGKPGANVSQDASFWKITRTA